MCEVMGRLKEGWLGSKDIENFPCTDLRTIDQLWVKHSQGQFGFSVQKKIWQEYGSPTTNNTNWEWDKFGEAVGWKKKGFLSMNCDWKFYDDITFDTSAPKGHLPHPNPLIPHPDRLRLREIPHPDWWGGAFFGVDLFSSLGVLFSQFDL